MKKTLAFIVAICMIATFSTCVFAVNNSVDSAFNFDNLLEGEGDINITQLYYNTLNGKLYNGCWVAAKDNSSLDGVLSTTKLNNIPVFVLTNPNVTTYVFPASNLHEKNKRIEIAYEYHGSWSILAASKFNQSIKLKDSSEIVGYTSDLTFGIDTNIDSKMFLFINSKNQVYPIIITTTDLDSGIKTIWEDCFPKNNNELTDILQQTFLTNKQYTFYINPIIPTQDSGDIVDSSEKITTSHKINSSRRPHYTISETSTDGGTISSIAPDNDLFLVGDINQKYIITADKGYTIAYIEVDGKVVPNSINCGDVATVTFDCIYGNRSVNVVFKKKE